MHNGFQTICTASGILQRVDNHCSDERRPTLKLKIDMMSVFFKVQNAVTIVRRNPVHINFFSVNYGLESFFYSVYY
jgi:hypothetical protein